jgi:actin-related protein
MICAEQTAATTATTSATASCSFLLLAWDLRSKPANPGEFQMWISKKEYEEHGAGLVDKRCK